MELRQRHFLTARAGFSLTEVLVVVGVLAIVVGISASGAVAARQRASYSKEASVAETTIRQAQQRALTAREGENWGVSCKTNHLQLFSFTSIGATDREIMTFHSGVTCQPGSEVRFTKLTGTAEADATFTLRANNRAFFQIQASVPGVITTATL